MVRRIALLMLAAVALLAAGCTGEEEKPTGPLPEAQGLLDDAAGAAEKITSTHFVVKVTGTVPGMAVKSIDGDLSVEGESVAAKGTGLITAFGGQSEVKFVLVDGTLHIDLGGGQFTELPESQAKTIYDFSAVLDADRGIAKLISSVEDAKTVGKADVGGESTYKINGTATKDVVAGLVPGAQDDVKVSLWVTEKDHQPVQATAIFPGEGGKQAGTVTVTLSKVNEPVTIEPPS